MIDLFSNNVKKEVRNFFTYKYGLLIFLFISISPELFAQAGYVNPEGKKEITFTPGLRIQPRYEYNDIDLNNDFYIARLRLKGKGEVYDLASYYFEVKIDNAGRFNKEPSAQVENAWLNFPVAKDINFRVGFYDMVFSRNALTSDSKLLLMDRSLIKDALTSIGMADNTVGLLVHGRPMEGHLSYGFGVFDNIAFETAGKDSTILSRKSDGVMTTGRLVYDFFYPASADGYGDYQGSYIGTGQRLSIGTNAGYLTNINIGENVYDLFAWGVDLFFNIGQFTLESEFDLYKENSQNGVTSNINGNGYYLQGAFLIIPMLELAARFQEWDPNVNTASDKLHWTTIGFNIYLKGHSLKIQTEYTFKMEQKAEIDNNIFQIQLQLDF